MEDVDRPRAAETIEPSTVEVTAHRREVKIVLRSQLLPDVRAWVRVHPAHWRRAYPSRQVNNIYFDTPAYSSLQANLGGTGDRSKLRLRWYGDCITHISGGQLELKRKRGTTGWKAILPLDVSLDLVSQRWRALTAEIRQVAGAMGQHWLGHFPVPVLINCYERDYYATPDGVLRLTIDRGLRAYDQRAACGPNLEMPAWLREEIVVELKAPTTVEGLKRLNGALGSLPPAVERFSKYVTGALASPGFW